MLPRPALPSRAAAEGLLDVAYTMDRLAIRRAAARRHAAGPGPARAAQPGCRRAAPGSRRAGSRRRVLEAPAGFDEARRELDLYFEGRLRDFELPLDWRLSKDFRRRALRAVARIPYGQTRSYMQVARRAGNERAVRAAGSACGSNPIPIVVPCHRVLRTGGGLGGYGGGLPMKRALLDMEAGLGGRARAKGWLGGRRFSVAMRRLPVPVALLLLALPAAIGDRGHGPRRPAGDRHRDNRRPARGPAIEDERPSFSFTATKNGEPFPRPPSTARWTASPPNPARAPSSYRPSKKKGGTASASMPKTPRRPPGTPVRPPAPSSTSPKPKWKTNAGREKNSKTKKATSKNANRPKRGLPRRPNACCAPPVPGSSPTPPTNKVRLVIRYTTYAPADVDVGYRLSGGKGSLKLGEAREHFARRGLFHLTEKLSKAEMARVRAARRFTVELDIPAAPSFCRRYETRHLTTKRSAHGQVVWLQSGSVFGAGS